MHTLLRLTLLSLLAHVAYAQHSFVQHSFVQHPLAPHQFLHQPTSQPMAPAVFYGRPTQTSQPSFAAPRPTAPLSHRVHHAPTHTNVSYVAPASEPLMQKTEIPTAVSPRETFGTATPNAIIHITAGQLLERLEQKQVTREPVYAVVLGTSLQGSAMTHTTVTPQLLPSDRGIEVALHLHSRAFSKATGTASAATAYNRGVTDIHGRKQILFTPAQFFTNNGEATANTQSDIVGFKWDRRFGERIARERAAEQKPMAEKITAQKAADQTRTQFDRQVDRQVRRFEAQYRENLPQQLAALPLQPNDVRFRSTQDTVIIESIFGGGATDSPPPSLRFNGRCQGMAIQLHESVITETLARLNAALAGQSLDEKDWGNRLGDLLPTRADALKVSNTRRQWTLGMAKSRPLKVSVGNDGLHVALKIDNFQVGKSKYPGMLIETVYTPLIEDGKIIAQREEKLKLTPLDEDGSAVKPKETEKTDKPKGSARSKRRLGVRQQIFRSMVRKRFDPIFAEEVPLGEQQRTLAGTEITISRIELDGEWATIQAISK